MRGDTFTSEGLGYEVLTRKTVRVSKRAGQKGDAVRIPDTVENGGVLYRVVKIGQRAFYNKKNLTSVTIPDSVTEIEEAAFLCCHDLTSITIPDSVTKIGEAAFYYCTSLTSVTIPDSVTKICEHAFYGCTSLTSVAIPDSVTEIEPDAFEGCACAALDTSDVQVTDQEKCRIAMELAVKQFSAMGFHRSDDCRLAFQGEYGVIYTGQELPDDENMPPSISIDVKDRWLHEGYDRVDSWRAEDEQARYDKELQVWLETPHIKQRDFSVDGIAYWVTSASSVRVESTKSRGKTVEIPSTVPNEGIAFTVSRIHDRAFAECKQLTAVSIPDSVESIGPEAFRDCSRLVSVELPDNEVDMHNHAFQDCTALESIVIPKSARRVGAHVFDGCDRLASINISGLEKKVGQWRSRLNPKSLYAGICPGWADLVFRYLDDGEIVPITASFLKKAPSADLIARMVLHSDMQNCENMLAVIRLLAENDEVDALKVMHEWGTLTKAKLDEAIEIAERGGAKRAIEYLIGLRDDAHGAKGEE